MMDYPNYKFPAARKRDRIHEDIAKIEKALEMCDEKTLLQVHQYIDGKYQACIAGWSQSVYGYVPGYGFNYDVIGIESLKHNLQMMMPKLEGFIEGWNEIATPATVATIPEINVNTTTNVNISVTFEQVRSKIEDMTALNREQTDEIIKKVDELEKISKEKSSRKTKWEKVKPSITFALDKGADVAVALLSLVMQMNLGS